MIRVYSKNFEQLLSTYQPYQIAQLGPRKRWASAEFAPLLKEDLLCRHHEKPVLVYKVVLEGRVLEVLGLSLSEVQTWRWNFHIAAQPYLS
jgi:hypothetical protein